MEDDDEETAEVAVQAKQPVTTEIVNEIASKLKSLSVQIGELGPDFCEVTRTINDGTDELRSVMRKMKYQKLAKKLSSGRQSLMSVFARKK